MISATIELRRIARYLGETDRKIVEAAADELGDLRRKLRIARAALWTAQNDYASADPHSPFVPALEETK